MYYEFTGTYRTLPFQNECFDIYRINPEEILHICYKPNECNLFLSGKNTVSESTFFPCFFTDSSTAEYTGSILEIVQY